MAEYIAVTIEEVHLNTYIMPAVLDDGSIIGVDAEAVARYGLPVPGCFEYSHLGEIAKLEYGPFTDTDFTAVIGEMEEFDD